MGWFPVDDPTEKTEVCTGQCGKALWADSKKPARRAVHKKPTRAYPHARSPLGSASVHFEMEGSKVFRISVHGRKEVGVYKHRDSGNLRLMPVANAEPNQILERVDQPKAQTALF